MEMERECEKCGGSFTVEGPKLNHTVKCPICNEATVV